MRIDVITLVRWTDLYSRMRDSAMNTASSVSPDFGFELDPGHPDIAAAYNRIGRNSAADILVFVHDDIRFLSQGWDVALVEGFSEGYEVLGVIGAADYRGFGFAHAKGLRGRFAAIVDGEHMVKMASGPGMQPVTILDGMLLATTREHFKNNKFDEKLDGLFFYDFDYCLGKKCAVVDVLVSHDKPSDKYGRYPDMKGMDEYYGYFHKKHGIVPQESKTYETCQMTSLEDYLKEERLTGRIPIDRLG